MARRVNATAGLRTRSSEDLAQANTQAEGRHDTTYCQLRDLLMFDLGFTSIFSMRSFEFSLVLIAETCPDQAFLRAEAWRRWYQHYRHFDLSLRELSLRTFTYNLLSISLQDQILESFLHACIECFCISIVFKNGSRRAYLQTGLAGSNGMARSCQNDLHPLPASSCPY